jgi:glycosyltransferase involved in cell wall biosynthesis
VPMTSAKPASARMRVAINLLQDDPRHPSGAHWVWTQIIPEMAKQLTPGEELHLVVSPKSREYFPNTEGNLRYITYPWSNERRQLRTASEHLYSPLRLPFNGIDLFATGMAPLVSPTWVTVAHIMTLHAFTQPASVAPLTRMYRLLSYPRTVEKAKAIVVPSESLRSEMLRYLDVDPAKINVVPHAVEHERFKPGDADQARAQVAAYGVTKPFVLFVSSLWPYKNCDGLLRAWADARAALGDRQLVIVGAGRDEEYTASLPKLAEELGIAGDVVFTGGAPIEETVAFYRAADVFVYPSFNETFGLPILEAMATGCPVVTSDITSMPLIAGGAALLADPGDPTSIAKAMIEALGPARDQLIEAGLKRAGEFTWSAAATATLDVYREVAERKRNGGK